MKIDIRRRTFALANRTGGLSGPAIRPVAVRMVYEAAGAVSIPVIGMGGITCADDAVEFMMAGARAVSVGTANFRNPTVTAEIADGIRDFLVRKNIADVNEIVGCVR
jgi:dihydroorotate dehydrogenase (NAD+) catalytic subunit